MTTTTTIILTVLGLMFPVIISMLWKGITMWFKLSDIEKQLKIMSGHNEKETNKLENINTSLEVSKHDLEDVKEQSKNNYNLVLKKLEELDVKMDRQDVKHREDFAEKFDKMFDFFNDKLDREVVRIEKTRSDDLNNISNHLTRLEGYNVQTIKTLQEHFSSK